MFVLIMTLQWIKGKNLKCFPLSFVFLSMGILENLVTRILNKAEITFKSESITNGMAYSP